VIFIGCGAGHGKKVRNGGEKKKLRSLEGRGRVPKREKTRFCEDEKLGKGNLK